MALSTNHELPESSINLAVTGGHGEQPLWKTGPTLAQAEEGTNLQDQGAVTATENPAEAVPSPAAEAEPGVGAWWPIGVTIVLVVIFVVWWQGRRRRRRAAPGATQTGEFLGRSERGRR